MNEAQRKALQDICQRYGVEFREEDYLVFPPTSSMMAGWAEGWVGGEAHARHRAGHILPSTTIYVGVSPEGEVHS